jgi:hypothetical protein
MFGSLFALNRQPGFIYLAAILITLILFFRKKIINLTIFSFSLVGLIIILTTLKSIGLSPDSASEVLTYKSGSIEPMISSLVIFLWNNTLLLTLFLSPLIISKLLKIITKVKIHYFIIIVIYLETIATSLYLQRLIFPISGNVVNFFGVGPSVYTTLPGFMPIWGPKYLYIFIHFFTPIVSGVVISYLFSNVRLMKHYIQTYPLIIIFTVLYFSAIATVRPLDRYLLLLIPGGIVLSLKIFQEFRNNKILFGLSLMSVILYSTIGTYNYLHWNRAKWNLANRLVNTGISPKDIEGGYEWNGWYVYANNHPNLRPNNQNSILYPWYTQALFPYHKPSIYLSFSPIKDFIIIDQEPSSSIFQKITIYALKKI